MIFAIVAVISFIALLNPFTSIVPTLLVPLAAFLLTPLSPIAAWSAWALAAIVFTFLPAITPQLKRVSVYTLNRTPQHKPAPVQHMRYR